MTEYEDNGFKFVTVKGSGHMVSSCGVVLIAPHPAPVRGLYQVSDSHLMSNKSKQMTTTSGPKCPAMEYH